MARVTVEDCLKNVKNRFELVIIAAKRARQLMRGKEPKVAWDNDKSTVVALREIAEGYVNFDSKEENREEHQLFAHKREPESSSAPVSASSSSVEKSSPENDVPSNPQASGEE